MRSRDNRLRKIATEAYERVLDRGDGRASLGDVESEIRTELDAHGIAADILDEIARDAARTEDDRRAAQSRSGQLNLLTGDDDSLDGIWRLGDGKRVVVRHAVRREYLQHLARQGENAARVAERLAADQRDAAELLPYMTSEDITVSVARELWRRDHPGGE